MGVILWTWFYGGRVWEGGFGAGEVWSGRTVRGMGLGVCREKEERGKRGGVWVLGWRIEGGELGVGRGGVGWGGVERWG